MRRSHPLDLIEFCEWIKTILRLNKTPDPSAQFYLDLGQDDFAMLNVVDSLQALTVGEAQFGAAVYSEATTIRALHLHYLEMISRPLEIIE